MWKLDIRKLPLEIEAVLEPVYYTHNMILDVRELLLERIDLLFEVVYMSVYAVPEIFELLLDAVSDLSGLIKPALDACLEFVELGLGFVSEFLQFRTGIVPVFRGPLREGSGRFLDVVQGRSDIRLENLS